MMNDLYANNIDMASPQFMCVEKLPDKGKAGVIYITKKNEEYVFIGGNAKVWEMIGTVESISTQNTGHVQRERNEIKKVTCDNCGGVLHNGKCEFCGEEQ